ncbi:MAG: hypothetical protein R8M45_10935, partial [Ghiorsea sp.]
FLCACAIIWVSWSIAMPSALIATGTGTPLLIASTILSAVMGCGGVIARVVSMSIMFLLGEGIALKYLLCLLFVKSALYMVYAFFHHSTFMLCFL